MAVGIVVGNPLKAGKILTGFQGSLFPRIDARSSHHQRTFHQGSSPARLVSLALPVDFHLVGSEVQMTSVGHHNLYDIFLRPFANGNLYIATGLILLRHRLTVQTNIKVLRSPIGHTQLHRKTSLACCHTNRAFLGRPLALLTERHTSLVPRGLSWQIERNPHRGRTLLADEVSSLLILHVVLGTCSTATS